MSKKKLTKLEKFLSDEYIEKDQRSCELYNKPASELTKEEYIRLLEYINDVRNPEWRPVILDGIKTVYEISNIGTLRNSENMNIRKPTVGPNGYEHLTLYIIEHGYSKSYDHLIHRLVAQAFIPNPENKPQVNHIDGIKTHNWYKNLEWATVSENSRHAIRMGLQPIKCCEDASVAKYRNDQIHQVCKLLEENKMTKEEISKKLGISRPVITSIA